MSTVNTDRPQQRWTRQLLRGSALLPRPSTLKLLSLPVASGASLRLALGDALRLALIPHRQLGHALLVPEGGCNCERNRRILRTSPPAFCIEAKVAKGGTYLRDTTVLEELTFMEGEVESRERVLVRKSVRI